MAASSSSVIPTPLAHADNQGEGQPRGVPLQVQCKNNEDLSMPPRRNMEKFQELTEFKRGRIFGLQEGGFSYREIGARVQQKSSTVMRVWKQWTDEH
ncbi:uncharacterized protein TNCV_815311 [Trichonephila clavipes]|nr:uncharacterized protein TNCV_815311 [Trichonephila clavipes]